MSSSIMPALLGGALIGAASSLMLLTLGRVTGISGILNSILDSKSAISGWQGFFLMGLISGGLVLSFLRPEALQNTLLQSDTRLIVAGIFVGFGTIMGNGCTSGHGVCGISRLSKRSIMATLAFMFLGMLSAGLL